MEVPLDWSAPQGKQITVLTRRLRPRGQSRGQLWALDGGPGESGDGFVRGWFRDTVLGAGYELIVPTHRGAAYSTPLACPAADGIESCIAELETTWSRGLRQFDAVGAARDVVAMARAYRPTSSATTLIFGGSYGTVWLQRVLQVGPGLFDGAYLDSAGDMAMNFERIGQWSEDAGRAVLDRCAQDASCASHFADGPQAAADAVLSAARRGEGCFQELSVGAPALKAVLTGLLGGVQERVLMAPLIRRLQRCGPQDLVTLRRVFEPGEQGPPLNVSSTYNSLLNLTAIYAGLYRVTSPREEIARLADSLLFESGAMLAHADRRALFPAAFARPSDLTGLTYAGPLRIVQGALDPLTPGGLGAQVAARWTHAEVDLFVLPEGGHASVRFTRRPDGERCSQRWLKQFMADPTAPLDRACMDAVPSVDWGLTRNETASVAGDFFGTEDAWGR